jgi:hypothetical protein
MNSSASTSDSDRYQANEFPGLTMGREDDDESSVPGTSSVVGINKLLFDPFDLVLTPQYYHHCIDVFKSIT